MQIHLLLKYKKFHSQATPEDVVIDKSDYPVVTIQLPIFNERYVVDRLIDNIALMDYPIDKLEIQVLDDSTDDTFEIVKKKIDEYIAKGFDIKHIHRVDRVGYKAGALQAGLDVCRGEFIAIFDADFLPRTDFLQRTIGHFQDPEIGVVQTKWEHINQDYSLITELQAFQLNVHFTVEQTGRQQGNLFLQFNGTAGVWRKETIYEAGGWEADTLTEDLDLSFRAQLKGWKIQYLEKVGSPAELPAEMNGLKSQQYRWMKGGAETAKKMIPSLWRSHLSLGNKIHSTIHLMSSAVFVFVFILGVFSVPLIFMLGFIGLKPAFLGFFLIGLLSIIMVYYVANVQASWKGMSKAKMVFKFLILFPMFLALSMGLSLHNTIAVLQGYWGKKSPFVRTPKFNLKDEKDTVKNKKYLTYALSWSTITEGFLALYFAAAVIFGLVYGNYSFLFFHVLLMAGFGSIFFYTVNHLRLKG